ncbi:DeoR/GlpR family DNA-binding transcription regulator [Georgenia alba]|uniref:DeoR/GlpR family DNA-binding transcription regulator n=1 Tax=Georgenia alba TaxID=2233858 RepID=A0ABW2Q7U7_9MICO
MGGEPRRGTRERHERLLERVRDGVTHVEELARALGVSSSTVRRDLARLVETGALTRTYGGAVLDSPFRESALADRLRVETAAKDAIGRRAAELVPEHGTIFLDAGSTTARLAEHLRGRAGLTVLTRGPEIALLLAGHEGPEVVLVGGTVAPTSHGLVGPLTTHALERFALDAAFLGVDAVHPLDGVGEPTLAEAETKEVAAGRAGHVVVLADATKLGRRGVPAWAPLPPGWTLVTNGTGEAVEPFVAAGVQVIGTAG